MKAPLSLCLHWEIQSSFLRKDITPSHDFMSNLAGAQRQFPLNGIHQRARVGWVSARWFGIPSPPVNGLHTAPPILTHPL